jgi:flagellar biosynthesis protein FlhB
MRENKSKNIKCYIDDHWLTALQLSHMASLSNQFTTTLIGSSVTQSQNCVWLLGLLWVRFGFPLGTPKWTHNEPCRFAQTPLCVQFLLDWVRSVLYISDVNALWSMNNTNRLNLLCDTMKYRLPEINECWMKYFDKIVFFCFTWLFIILADFIKWINIKIFVATYIKMFAACKTIAS